MFGTLAANLSEVSKVFLGGRRPLIFETQMNDQMKQQEGTLVYDKIPIYVYMIFFFLHISTFYLVHVAAVKTKVTRGV